MPTEEDLTNSPIQLHYIANTHTQTNIIALYRSTCVKVLPLLTTISTFALLSDNQPPRQLSVLKNRLNSSCLCAFSTAWCGILLNLTFDLLLHLPPSNPA